MGHLGESWVNANMSSYVWVNSLCRSVSLDIYLRVIGWIGAIPAARGAGFRTDSSRTILGMRRRSHHMRVGNASTLLQLLALLRLPGSPETLSKPALTPGGKHDIGPLNFHSGKPAQNNNSTDACSHIGQAAFQSLRALLSNPRHCLLSSGGQAAL